MGPDRDGLGAETLSAYDWLGVPGGGAQKKGCSGPAHSLQRGSIPQLCSSRGAWDGARSLACLPRRGEAQGPLHLSRQHPLFASPDPGAATLLFLPQGAGCDPARWIKDSAFGIDPHFKQSYNREKCGFTRNVGDYLLYISTFHSTKGFTYFV